MSTVQIGEWESGVTMRIEGLEEARRIMAELPQKIVRRVVSAGIRAGNKVIIAEARRQAPRGESGRLVRQIRGSVKTNRRTGTVYGSIKARATKREKETGKEVGYYSYVIRGTRPHAIPKPKGASYQYVPGEGVVQFQGKVRARVDHPGAKPNPFMDRTARIVFDAAVAAFRAKFLAKLDEEVLKASNA